MWRATSNRAGRSSQRPGAARRGSPCGPAAKTARRHRRIGGCLGSGQSARSKPRRRLADHWRSSATLIMVQARTGRDIPENQRLWSRTETAPRARCSRGRFVARSILEDREGCKARRAASTLRCRRRRTASRRRYARRTCSSLTRIRSRDITSYIACCIILLLLEFVCGRLMRGHAATTSVLRGRPRGRLRATTTPEIDELATPHAPGLTPLERLGQAGPTQWTVQTQRLRPLDVSRRLREEQIGVDDVTGQRAVELVDIGTTSSL